MRPLSLPEQKQKRLKLRHAKWILLGLGLFLLLGLDALLPLDFTRFHNSSPLLYDKEGELLSVALSKDQFWRIKADIKKVDPLFLKMLISYEDKRFYYHPGIDPLALSRALFQRLTSGHVISGGSTLTLQTVRLLEPRPRTVKSKLIECLRALQLEAHFSKNEILEMYLTLAPYGGNVEGINAASLRYFGKSPQQLRASEAALLVVMPQLPNHLRSELYPDRARRYRDKVINRLVTHKILTQNCANEAIDEGVPLKIHRFPRYALHMLNQIILQGNKTEPKHSTLQKALQIQVEALLKSELPFLEPMQTIAVLVVDNKTKMIRSYVGNADFFDEGRRGQVNMIDRVRSPGSTLKPFIYGLGFDEGIIIPETILQDVPTTYGDYAPTNFKDIFHGEVTVREALQQSLNIPAITVLESITPGRFMAHLQQTGVLLTLKTGITQATLPIALGGVGMTLKDLVSLYVALANEGQFSPVTVWKHFEADNVIKSSITGSTINSTLNSAEIQLMSPHAARLISDILRGSQAPDGFISGELTGGTAIAYKTGTSYGFRDAWAIGYTTDYTVGVWVGKPDGTPSFNQTGRQNAAPVLFKLMHLLPNSKQPITAKSQGSIHQNIPLAPSQLPLSLRKFSAKHKKNSVYEKTFYIQFPKDGMVINASSQSEKEVSSEACNIDNFTLVLKGGKSPFYLFVNGNQIVDAHLSQTISYQPSFLGFHEITIVDSAGHAESVTIEVQ